LPGKKTTGLEVLQSLQAGIKGGEEQARTRQLPRVAGSGVAQSSRIAVYFFQRGWGAVLAMSPTHALSGVTEKFCPHLLALSRKEKIENGKHHL
jgi:hypothetical protein